MVAVGFNLIIALSWCVLRQHKKLKTARLRKSRLSVPIDYEKYEVHAAFATSTKENPAAIRPKAKGDVHHASTSGVSYYELIRSLQLPLPQPLTQSRSSPTRLSPAPSRGSPDSAKLKQFILRPQDIKGLEGVSYYPKTKHRHTARRSVNMGMPPRWGERRPHSISAETASVYSATSAPLDLHEHLSRTSTFTLEPIPASAPPWATNLPKPPAPAVLIDTTAMEFEIPLPSPTTSTSECSLAKAERPTPNGSQSSPGASSPIALSNVSTPSLVRARANSNPSAPPQVRWLTKGPAKDVANDTAPSPEPSKRPNSTSSLSTLVSLHENALAPPVPTVAVAPLNVPRRSNDSRWGSVDMARGGAPLVLSTVRPSTTPTVGLGGAPPALPRRSSKRPAPPPSSERLRR